MLGFIKEKLKKVYNQVTSKAASLFSRQIIDQTFLDELEALLISADTGIETTNTILKKLATQVKEQKITTPQQIKEQLKTDLYSLLYPHKILDETPSILLLVGINGSGKTTFAAKLAHRLQQKGKKVLLVAGDTFRAAATQQLSEWGKKINVDVFIGRENQDPASVIFDGCKTYKEKQYDHLIIDTAGRVQTKTNLMKELSKIRSILNRHFHNQTIDIWLTIDAMLGQNSLEQAKLFHEATSLTGLVLTKFDGTGKGGIVFAISNTLQLPLIYVTFGEEITTCKPFDPQEYIQGLFE